MILPKQFSLNEIVIDESGVPILSYETGQQRQFLMWFLREVGLAQGIRGASIEVLKQLYINYCTFEGSPTFEHATRQADEISQMRRTRKLYKENANVQDYTK